MTKEGAQTAVLTSAVLVGGVYAYRRLIEGPGQSAHQLASKTAAKQLAGQGNPPPLAHFLVGYGFAFLVMSMVAEADPDLGGGFAILVGVATVLAQGQQLFADLNGQLGAGPSQAVTPTALANDVAGLPGGSSSPVGQTVAVPTGPGQAPTPPDQSIAHRLNYSPTLPPVLQSSGGLF